jgi:3-hydroxyacyl-[acyl-carrier-protein] dehydratase
MITDYYSFNRQRAEGETIVFDVTLNPDCPVYQGHFPDNPVAPGVCNIQMIKECTERIAGCPLLLEYLGQCRLTTLMTPEQHPQLNVGIRVLENNDTHIHIQASVGLGEVAFVTLKGVFFKEK